MIWIIVCGSPNLNKGISWISWIFPFSNFLPPSTLQVFDLHSGPKPVVFVLHSFLSAKLTRMGLLTWSPPNADSVDERILFSFSFSFLFNILFVFPTCPLTAEVRPGVVLQGGTLTQGGALSDCLKNVPSLPASPRPLVVSCVARRGTRKGHFVLSHEVKGDCFHRKQKVCIYI